MRTLNIIILAFLIINCVSSLQSASLTPERAEKVAIQLANAKALIFYHCKPFSEQRAKPAHFLADHWIWTEECGFGCSDIQATVELAADGTTNNVKVFLLDCRPDSYPSLPVR